MPWNTRTPDPYPREMWAITIAWIVGAVVVTRAVVDLFNWLINL
jgi:hypothetical protein